MARFQAQGEGVETPVGAPGGHLRNEGGCDASPAVVRRDDEVHDEGTIRHVIPGGFAYHEDRANEGTAVPGSHEGILGGITEGTFKGKTEFLGCFKERLGRDSIVVRLEGEHRKSGNVECCERGDLNTLGAIRR